MVYRATEHSGIPMGSTADSRIVYSRGLERHSVAGASPSARGGPISGEPAQLKSLLTHPPTGSLSPLATLRDLTLGVSSAFLRPFCEKERVSLDLPGPKHEIRPKSRGPTTLMTRPFQKSAPFSTRLRSDRPFATELEMRGRRRPARMNLSSRR